MKTSEIRKKFIDFFASRGHQPVASSPLVPGNDPTLLFTNAGMVHFKGVVPGVEKRAYNRAVTSQRCVRAGGKHNCRCEQISVRWRTDAGQTRRATCEASRARHSAGWGIAGSCLRGPEASAVAQAPPTRSISMHKFLKIVALFLATLLPAHAPAANTFGTDFSDLWWNAQESGWGANIVHQGDTIFMTLFAYGPDSNPKWYVASSMASRNADETTHAFDGVLYETTGPYLGSAFNPAGVAMRAVGNASLLFSAIGAATLSYSIDGVNVSKQVTRQTFRNNDLGGSYFGAQVGDKSNCGAENGPVESVARYSIVHSGSNIEITATLSDVSLQCVYTGVYIQQGSVGESQGDYICSNGTSGTYFAADIEASDKGFLARYYAARPNGCSESGIIGGAKR